MIQKVSTIGIFTLFFTFAHLSWAQEDPISDEDLQLYAAAMDSIDVLKAALKTQYNDLVKSEELMNGGKRFKEILAAKGDQEALAEINATEEELAVFDSIQTKYAAWKEEFKASTNTIIKEMLGATLYNRIKKAMKKDEALVARYEALKAAMQEKDMETMDEVVEN